MGLPVCDYAVFIRAQYNKIGFIGGLKSTTSSLCCLQLCVSVCASDVYALTCETDMTRWTKTACEKKWKKKKWKDRKKRNRTLFSEPARCSLFLKCQSRTAENSQIMHLEVQLQRYNSTVVCNDTDLRQEKISMKLLIWPHLKTWYQLESSVCK